jgi:hypothetical protein
MGAKDKWFEDKQHAFAKLYADVGQNNVKVYDIPDYTSKVQIPVHPKALLSKCTHVDVAISGDAATGEDWMIIAPYRVDEDSGQKVYDLDPILTVLDCDTGTASQSGVVAFHQDFTGRTSKIQGYERGTMDYTVSDLRQNLTTGQLPLESGSQPLLNGLAHMHNKYRDDFGIGQ